METVRTLILVTGWPILFMGSVMFAHRTIAFYRDVDKNIIGQLALYFVLGILVTMYSLGIISTAYMFTDVERGVVFVLPVFIVWAIVMGLVTTNIFRLREAAIHWSRVYVELKKSKEELSKALEETQARELELARANEELKVLDQLKTEFVSIAAHQLRTPLAAIRWALRAVLEGDTGPLSDTQKSTLEKADTSSHHLLSLVNEMLDVDRIEAGIEPLTTSKTHLNALIDDVAKDLLHLIDEKHIQFSFERGANVNEVEMDPIKIQAVVQNLLENAIRYTPKGGSVRVETLIEGDHVKVNVEDSGIGIPKDQQKEMFNKFFRADNAKRFATEGTGLGLYMSRQIIDKHGGILDFISEEGKGSTFSFTLPLVSGQGELSKESLKVGRE